MPTTFNGNPLLAGAGAGALRGPALVENFPRNFPADETKFVLDDDDPITEGAVYLVNGIPTTAYSNTTVAAWKSDLSASEIRFYNYRRRATLLPVRGRLFFDDF
jgi:hypothetical protein